MRVHNLHLRAIRWTNENDRHLTQARTHKYVLSMSVYAIVVCFLSLIVGERLFRNMTAAEPGTEGGLLTENPTQRLMGTDVLSDIN